MNTDNERVKRIEDFLLDPERALFTTLEEFRTAVNELLPVVRAIDLKTLGTLKGEDGRTPLRGTDYMTADDISALEAFILSKMPQTDVDYPSVSATEAFINFQIAKIPRIKGDRGDDGRAGTPGKDGSPDTATEIIQKLRTLGKNQKLQIDDIRGLEERIRLYNTAVDELAQLREDFDNQRVILPANPNGGSSVPIGSNYVSDAQLIIINNTSGTNSGDQVGDGTTITGAGTPGDPFVATVSGGMTNPMTTAGDMIYGGLVGTATRLGIGSDGQVLTVVAGNPVWSAVAGTGDVVGPASAVDNRVAFFDGVSGKLIKDSGLTLSGSNTGDQDLSAYLLSATAASTYEPIKGADDNYVTDAQLVVIGNTSGTNTGDNATNTQYSGLAASKQDTLVSGTNIKTVNGATILGAGDLVVGGASGTTTSVAQTAHGFVVGDVIRNAGTANTYAKAQADSAANAEVVGIVSVVTDANNFIFTTEGIVTAGVPVNTAGTTYFLSPSTAGLLTATEPVAVGQISKPLAVILQSGAVMYFHNYRGMIIAAPAPSTAFSGVRAYQNAASGQLGATLRLLEFQVEQFDTDTFHDNSTNPSRITFLAAGKYAFGGSVQTGVGVDMLMHIRLNGTTKIISNSVFKDSSGIVAGQNSGGSIGGIYQFAANDYIEFLAAASGASFSSGDLMTNFWAYKIE